VPDFFAPGLVPKAPVAAVPEPPAATPDPVVAITPESEPAPRPEPTVVAAPEPPVVEARRPALFDREAHEHAEVIAPPPPAPPAAPPVLPTTPPPAPVERVETEPVEAAVVDGDSVEPVERTKAQRNPLDDLFIDRDDVAARRESKPKRAPRAKAEPKPKREPKREPKPEPEARDTEPQPPSHASGPWKPPHSRRRKHKQGPVPPPWEGRFDTTRDRDLPFTPATPLPAGSAPLAVCVRHPGVVTRLRCTRCGEPACDECLVSPRGRRSSMCIECAIIEAGVRSRRRTRG
jgi:hypothetical protein